jgi:hypothetical protein
MSLNATLFSIKKLLFAVSLLLVLPIVVNAQVTPAAGEVQCFAVGEGGLFVDIGGIGGDDDIEGAPGNYPNCDCVTTTTLCGVDGSSVSLDYTSFGVFATFDWVVILNADNPLDEVYPASILTDPANVDLQLFNNADGVGDGGSENYGSGSENGVTDLAGMPTTNFIATNPSGCLTIVFRASGVVDDSGWEALISTTSGASHPGDDVPCGASVSCPPPSNVAVSDITPDFANVTWNAADSTDTYEVEFGPEGFALGSGNPVSVVGTELDLSNLEENTCYDVYITAICDNGDVSATIGPVTFCTPFLNPPDVCLYTVNLFDSFGDGWNGSFLDVTVNGQTTTFTLDNINDDGSFASYTFEVLDGLPVDIEYTAGAFQTEVTYEILDSDGLLLFNDGPNPATGLVYSEDAFCPDCPAINPATLSIEDVTTNLVQLLWIPIASAEDYTVEYGPAGFPQGFGLTFTTTTAAAEITGLNPCVEYDFYITANCGVDAGSSTPVGPITITTLPENAGDPCIYTLELFDSVGDGWNNASLVVTVNGVTNTYTFFSGFSATFEVTAFSNLPIVIEYVPGTFENEVSFNILDPDDNVIYSDGPFPQTGEILNIVACPTCAGPNALTMLDVNATNAIAGWDAAIDPGDYFIEYGPLGFTLGTGMVISGSDITSATLTGLQENTYYDVYIRYFCEDGEPAKTLGPVTFKTLWLVDVGVAGVLSPTVDACNLGVETIEIELGNFGQSPQQLIPFFYAVNGIPQPVSFPTDGLYTGVIGNDSTEVATFDLQYDFSAPGYYLVEVWTEQEGDSDLSNDTFAFELITALPLPLVEDFESQVFPEGWTTDEFNPIFAPNAHNNPTWIISDNVWSADPSFVVTTERYGPIGSDATLSFDYRYVDYFGGTIATVLNGDMLEVQVSEDCGDTFETIFVIDEGNHVPSVLFENIELDLSAYAGTGLTVRWVATWASGDYWVDLDNINITGCPNTLLLDGSVVDASDPGAADGSITVTNGLGVGPFQYDWSDGQMTQTATGLPAGDYSVTVTDVNGCQDIASFTVGAMVGAEELAMVQNLNLSPNPTSGIFWLEANLNVTEEVFIEVFNITGQRLHWSTWQPTDRISEQIDITGVADGIYFIRLTSGGNAHVEKLIVAASAP